MSSRLCPPAEAISSARRASSWPRTSARSAAWRTRDGAAAGEAWRTAPPDRSAPARHRRATRRHRRSAPRRPRPLRRSARAEGSPPGLRVSPPRRSGSTPRVGWIDPSSESSPSSTQSAISRRSTTPCAARMPSAIGRSNDAPAFRTSAGARFTVMRWAGNSKPELRIALRTRSRLSRTLASGRPTIVKPGNPNDTSTSTWTGQASMPKTAAVRRLASISIRTVQCKAPRQAASPSLFKHLARFGARHLV